jgi:hypothetical protein
MRIGGVWVGWGLGDNSAADMTVKNFKAFARRMYMSYMGHLADTNKFDQQLYDALCLMQDKLVAGGKLIPGQFLRGVLDLATQRASGFKKADVVKPIIFSVEGHLANIFIGPAADTATQLEIQDKVHHKPIGYDNGKLPFNNRSGVDELALQVGSQQVQGPPGVLWPFPPGTPWGVTSFSQGAMIASEFMQKQVLPSSGPLHWRLKDFKRGLAFGNPRREKDKVCAWATDPPLPGTEGIMGKGGLFVTTGTAIEGKWAEHPRRGDMFAENNESADGKDKTAIAKIITENSWIGGEAAIFARVLAMFGNLPSEGFAAIKATVSAIMFLAKNPNPHYSTVAEPGDISWMAGVAA